MYWQGQIESSNDSYQLTVKTTGAKLMSRNFFVWLLTTVLLTTAFSAEAQQPTKIPRIGFLSVTSLSTISARIELSAKVCASLAMWKGKTSSLSYDLRGENSIASQRSRPNWCVSR
jgi:hypothetical protein